VPAIALAQNPVLFGIRVRLHLLALPEAEGNEAGKPPKIASPISQ
jgi:hypothetical protein